MKNPNMKNNPKLRAKRKRMELPKGYIIEVTHKSYYMFDYPPNGQSAEDIMEEWFWQYPLMSRHEGRDSHLLGNVNPILEVKVVTEDEMVETFEKSRKVQLGDHYRKFSDLLKEDPIASKIYEIANPIFGRNVIQLGDEVYIPKKRYEYYLELIANEKFIREQWKTFNKEKRKAKK